MSTRRILVTGANGFIGRQSLMPLLQSGFEVHATSLHVAVEPVREVQWHAADLLLPRTASVLMEKIRPTHILHFGWYAEHGKFWDSPLNLDWLTATLSLLQEFERTGGRRFVGAGTCAEYDWKNDVFDEAASPLRPATLYGAAKASAFLTGSAFSKMKKISFAWGRIFNLFGPGESPARIVPALIRAHLLNEPLNCSQGTQLRDFLPAPAIAEAFAKLCDTDVQGAVNIGSGRGMNLIELSDKISHMTGRKAEIRFGEFQDKGPGRLVPAVERLSGEVGWKPPLSIDSALADAVEWWKTRTG